MQLAAVRPAHTLGSGFGRCRPRFASQLGTIGVFFESFAGLPLGHLEGIIGKKICPKVDTGWLHGLCAHGTDDARTPPGTLPDAGAVWPDRARYAPRGLGNARPPGGAMHLSMDMLAGLRGQQLPPWAKTEKFV